jgi:predicted RNA-binding Zn ribbon-like protein
MTGENTAFRVEVAPAPQASAAPQPGGRSPAPGELALVQAFINSHFDLERDHGADLFATPDGLQRWLSGRALLPSTTNLTGDDLRRVRAVREGLRAVARVNAERGPAPTPAVLKHLDEAVTGAALEVRFEPRGPRLIAGAPAGLDRALGVIVAIAVRTMLDGSWARLKVCPGEHCGWAFYDHSRNQSGRWCSMAVCGGRAKARAHYRRRRPQGSKPSGEGD